MQLRYQTRRMRCRTNRSDLDQDIKMAEIESREVFVEALVTATAKRVVRASRIRADLASSSASIAHRRPIWKIPHVCLLL